MRINVAQLLKEEIGAERDYEMDSVCHVGEKTAPVAGHLKLIRINRGILVRGRLRAEMPLSCSRCLEDFAQPLILSPADTYWQTADVTTGERLPVPPEAAGFTIGENHLLDLSEGIRQHLQLETPLKPLCREDCRGICPQCGRNLNLESCACAAAEVDPRWVPLIELSRKQKEEND